MDIQAPLSGWIIPLAAVPDPVLASKMAGDGVGIDPTSNEVLAPVAGRVTQFHRAHHALAITADNGVEVLIHIGLDTVALGGHGFAPLVSLGARVERGQPLLRFDADAVAREARSLISVVLVTNGDRSAALQAATGLVEAGKSTLLTLDGAVSAAEPTAGETVRSRPIDLPNAEGLHARPAAVLAAAARRFSSSIRVVRGADEADGKSVVALMGLSTRRGDRVEVVATGPDAAAAVAALSQLLAEGCGEEPGATPVAPAPVRAVSRVPGALSGVPASPGLAIGHIARLRRAPVAVPEIGGSERDERTHWQAALREAALQLEALKRRGGDATRLGILDVQLALLEDPALMAVTEAALGQGKSAAFAWQQAFTRHAARLAGLDNPLLRERASDVRDLGQRVLDALTGAPEAAIDLTPGAIVVAEEVTASELTAFDRASLAGLCTTGGSPLGHVAIVARGFGVPVICGIDARALDLSDGAPAVIDGTRGLLRVRPSDEELREAQREIDALEAAREAEWGAAFRPGRTRDGQRIEIAANASGLEEARTALAAGAEGVGLLRTELMFEGRAEPPGEDEQAAAYSAIAQAIGEAGRFIVRTLDVGGDKPLPYLPLPPEANPFLGMRGIRVSLDRPELFRTQLRAILRAAPADNVHVMFPMVTALDELRAARAILTEEQQGVPRLVKVGIMVEVPAAAALADILAREVDFFSIGTNDLTQYVLAIDRGHPMLASQADGLHPAVLRAIAQTVEGARKHERWVGVCGGLASDPLAAPLLVGLGVTELSVAVPAVATVKAALSHWSLAECQAVAAAALELASAAEVRALLAAQRPAPGKEA